MPKRSHAAKIECVLSRMPVEATGAKKNTLLIGKSPRNRGAMLKLDQDVGPYADVLEQIREDGNWEPFVHQVTQLSVFATREETEAWLEAHQIRKNKSLPVGQEINEETGEIIEAKITILQYGEATSQLLSLARFGEKEWTSSEIEEVLGQGKKSFVLHREGWSIYKAPTIPPMYKDQVVFDLESLEEVTGETKSSHKSFINLSPKVGIWYESSTKDATMAHFLSLLENDIGHHLKKFTLGQLKSLLQKLIRYSAQMVSWRGHLYETANVLRSCFLAMLSHHGEFIPQLQKYERGLEAIKRVVVIWFEDSCVVSEKWDNDLKTIRGVLLASVIAQRESKFFPIKAQVDKWLDLIEQMRMSNYAFKYRGTGKDLESIEVKQNMTNILESISSLFDALTKAFIWDHEMIHLIAKNPKFYTDMIMIHPPVMPLENFIDHHVAPADLAYSMDKESVAFAARERMKKKEVFGDFNKQPFAALFESVFKLKTGLNPRKHKIDPNECFFQMVQEAQARVANFNVRLPEREAKVEKEWKVTLDPMWIAGALGHLNVEVKIKTKHHKFWVFIKSMDPLNFGVVRQISSRGKRIEEKLDENLKQCAIEKAREQLRLPQGVKLHKSPFPHFQSVTLDDLTEGVANLPMELIDFTHSELEWEKLFSSMSVPGLRRLKQLSAGYVSSIVLPKLTRNGGPDDEPVSIHDVEVAQFLRELCDEAPEVMIRGQDPRHYHILKPCVWRSLVESMIPDHNQTPENRFKFHDDIKGRTLKTQQVDALANLKTRWEMGRTCSMLIMPPGTGKTLVMMNFLRFICESSSCSPTTIIYSVPSEGMESVIEEILCLTPDVDVYDPRKTTKPSGKYQVLSRNESPRPGRIVVIREDHLRCVPIGAWDDLFPNSFIICDECHKCLATTQRTATMQQWMSGAMGYLCATGTPVIDDNIYRLLPFLRRIAPFEIQHDAWFSNFFVGYMPFEDVTRPNIRVHRSTVYQVISNIEYLALLPSKFGGQNTRSLNAGDLSRLSQLTTIEVNEKMKNLTVEKLAMGHKVFVVVKDKSQAETMYQSLTQETKGAIGVILTKEDVRSMTPESCAWDVVIVPISFHLGYTATRFDVQISCICWKNVSVREQMEGRIWRASSPYSDIYYVTVIGGLVEQFIHNRQSRQDSFAAVLRDVNS